MARVSDIARRSAEKASKRREPPPWWQLAMYIGGGLLGLVLVFQLMSGGSSSSDANEPGNDIPIVSVDDFDIIDDPAVDEPLAPGSDGVTVPALPEDSTDETLAPAATDAPATSGAPTSTAGPDTTAPETLAPEATTTIPAATSTTPETTAPEVPVPSDDEITVESDGLNAIMAGPTGYIEVPFATWDAAVGEVRHDLAGELLGGRVTGFDDESFMLTVVLDDNGTRVDVPVIVEGPDIDGLWAAEIQLASDS